MSKIQSQVHCTSCTDMNCACHHSYMPNKSLLNFFYIEEVENDNNQNPLLTFSETAEGQRDEPIRKLQVITISRRLP